MSDVQTAAPAAAAAPVNITTQDAAKMLAERREAKNTHIDASAAGRALAQQRIAKARDARTTQAPPGGQEASQEADQHVEDDPTQGNPEGEALDEATAAAETPTDENADAQDDPDNRTIDLGDGVALPVAEVREMIMLKADHTRRNMALAEERKAFESQRTQSLAELDGLLKQLRPAAQSHKGKTRGDFIQEFGPIEGLDRWDNHVATVQHFTRLAEDARKKADTESRTTAEKRCDEYLVTNYRKEWAVPQHYQAAQVEITKYATKLGFSPDEIYQLGVHPGAMIALDKARRLDELEAGKASVTRSVAEKPKVVRPGAKVSAQAHAQSSVVAARAKAKSSGKISDAVALLQTQRKAGART